MVQQQCHTERSLLFPRTGSKNVSYTSSKLSYTHDLARRLSSETEGEKEKRQGQKPRDRGWDWDRETEREKKRDAWGLERLDSTLPSGCLISFAPSSLTRLLSRPWPILSLSRPSSSSPRPLSGPVQSKQQEKVSHNHHRLGSGETTGKKNYLPK